MSVKEVWRICTVRTLKSKMLGHNCPLSHFYQGSSCSEHDKKQIALTLFFQYL